MTPLRRRLPARRVGVAALVVVAGLALGAVIATPAAAAATTPSPQPAASVPAPAASTTTAPPSTAPGIGLGPSFGPTVTPPGAGVSTGGGTSSSSGGGCGFFAVSCHITAAIDGWFRGLVTSALNPVLSLLGRTVLATPEVTGIGRVAQLWRVTLGIADGFFVLLGLIGGAVVMSHETLQTRYSIKEIAPRLVVGVIAANASLAVAGLAIRVADAFSAAFVGGGVNPTDAAGVLSKLVLSPLGNGGMFLVLLGLVAAILAVVLLAIYVVRVALVILLVVAAPILLACHALPQTEGLARLWWRGLAAALGVQVAQSLVLISALRVFLATGGHAALGLSAVGGLVDVLLAATLLWVLVRIPAWGMRLAFAGTGQRGSSVAHTVKTAVVYKAVRAGMAAL
ncbi:MAG: hypothetical protein ACYCUG_00035 [Acidimicrobiales bacterium]